MEKKKKLPADADRCSHANGKGWRCNNLRMSYDGVSKSKFCEKHYNYFAQYKRKNKKKKRSGDAGSGPDLDMERKNPPDEERCCHGNGKGWRCSNFRKSYGSANAIDDARVPKSNRCEKHYNYFAEYKKKMKKRSGSGPDLEKQVLPPDEERCCHTSGGGNGIERYRCKNFRMRSQGADDDKKRLCEKHHNYFAKYFKNLKEKKTSKDGKGSKRRRENEDDAASDIQGGSAKVGTKRKTKKLPPKERRSQVEMVLKL